MTLSGLYTNKYGDWFLWDASRNRTYVWSQGRDSSVSRCIAEDDHTSGECPECGYVYYSDGTYYVTHWSRDKIEAWSDPTYEEGMKKVEKNYMDLPLMAQCADCGTGLTYLDYLCEECRA